MTVFQSGWILRKQFSDRFLLFFSKGSTAFPQKDKSLLLHFMEMQQEPEVFPQYEKSSLSYFVEQAEKLLFEKR